MQILSDSDINAKIKRLAYQILEQYTEEGELYLLGINNNGSRLRDLIGKYLLDIDSKFKTIQSTIKLNPANPTSNPIEIDQELSELSNKHILIIDDVANTGRTLFYASTLFKDTLVKSIRTCVLVDRKHKSFPIHVDFVGLSLATTMNENITVALEVRQKYSAVLD